jgi:HEAT repeat protein
MGFGRWRVALGLAWLGLVVAPGAYADEPYWNSKPLSYWVGLLQNGKPLERAHAAREVSDLAAARGADTVAPALPHLIAAFDAALPELRGAAATGVGHFGPAAGAAVPGLTKLVANDPDPDVRAHAARSLGQIAPTADEVVEACATVLGRDRAPAVRQAAAAVLLLAGPAAVKGRPALVGALADGDATVRVFAAGAVGQFGDDATALPVLFGGLEHEDAAVRAEAAALLATIPSAHAAVVPALTRALGDPDPLVRLASAQALGQIGEPARPALQPLWRLIRDEDEAVREGALRAIKRIR